jgi:hypothetical protein
MKTENLGNLTVRMSLSSNADGSVSVTGEFVSDSSQGNEALQKNASEIAENLYNRLEGTLDDGIADSNITFGSVNADAASGLQSAATGRISHSTACRVVVDVVRTMTEIA